MVIKDYIIVFLIGLLIAAGVNQLKQERIPVSDGDSPQTVRKLIQSLAPEYELVVRRVKND